MKSFCITIVALLISLSSYAQLSNNVSIGIGRYDHKGFQNYCYKVGFENNLNTVFSLGLNVSYNSLSQKEYFIKSDLPPYETYSNIKTFEGMSAELTLGAYLFGFSQDKFQTHLSLGAGTMYISNYAFVGFASVSLEERVKFSSKYQMGLGFNYGYDLDGLDRIGQGYVCLRRSF